MESDLKSCLENLRAFVSEKKLDAYVIGGTIRDHLLGIQSADHDFTARQAAKIAREFASQNKLTAVPLDDTPGRETVRVVFQKQIYFDFTEMQGKDIHEDLLRRDFSINAMALPLRDFPAELHKVIDPANGRADLKTRTIRMVCAQALSDDPLRMLRAFRFASHLGFSIEPQTLDEISRQKQRISAVAAERTLYELLLFLNADAISPLLESMDACGLLESILPETAEQRHIALWEDTLHSFAKLDDLILNAGEILPAGDRKHTSAFKQPLIRLAMLLQWVDRESEKSGPARQYGLPETAATLQRLRMSNADREFVLRALKYQKEALQSKLSFAADPIDASLLYRFTRDAGEELLAALFLTCATDRNLLPRARKTADFYCHRYLQAIKQEGFLNGNDLIHLYNLSPGPLIRVILDRVEEARVLGTISTRKEAEQLAAEIIQQGNTP